MPIMQVRERARVDPINNLFTRVLENLRVELAATLFTEHKKGGASG